MNNSYICPRCGAQMDDEILWYSCPKCGLYGHEETNPQTGEAYLVTDDDDDDYDDIYDDELDIPECCKACGGPYPSCTTSCKIFDD